MLLEADNGILNILDEDFDLDITEPQQMAGPVACGGNGSQGEAVSGLASADVASPNGLETAALPWAEYLQKVKETFIKAKPLQEVELLAHNMGFRDWMDYLVKLMPKDIKIESNVNFKAMIATLGPINKDDYRLSEPVQDAEFTEIPDNGGCS